MMSNLLSECFESIEREAFRLEQLPQYEVPQEEAALALYFAGEPLAPQPRAHDARIGFQKKAKRNCKHIRRVRVTPPHLTPYLRFEIEWCYASSDQAGVEIRFLPEAVLPEIVSSTEISDFWLFDDKSAALMRHRPYGRFLAAERVDLLMKSQGSHESNTICWSGPCPCGVFCGVKQNMN